MKTVFTFLKPYKALFALTVVFVLLDVVGALVIPTITADMINTGVSSGNMRYILQKGLLMLGVTVLAGASALLGSYLSARLSANLGRDLRNAVYERSLAFSVRDFERFGTGSMITRTLNDVAIVQQAVVWCIQMVLPVPALAVVGIAMAFSIDASMGALLAAAVVFVLVLALFISRRASSIFEKMQHFLDRMNVVLRENITGTRVIRAFGREKREGARLSRSFSDYAEAAIRTNRLFAGLDSLSFFAINLLIVAILWLGGNRIGTGSMQIGDITALTEYTILILFYLIMAQMVLILLPRARVCLRRLEEVLRQEPEIRDGTQQPALPQPAGDVVAEFRGASFRFADAQENTLGDLSFVCRRGQTTAIIGGTGSGKSTVAKLLLRFHDVTEGAVLLNGQDIRTLPQQALRERIAYVPQQAWLFSGTVEENLRCGAEHATPAQMRHALQVAQADFVDSLDGGLQAHVAQGGMNFSGGQKQRLAIARALMKRAELYVFDDSFSALDFKTDRALRRALETQLRDAAVLVIAQRVSTIAHAAQILVLQDGRIVGAGTHEQLLERCEVYREIAESQRKGAQEDGAGEGTLR